MFTADSIPFLVAVAAATLVAVIFIFAVPAYARMEDKKRKENSKGNQEK